MNSGECVRDWIADIMGVETSHVLTSAESNCLAWTCAVGNGLSLHFGRGLASDSIPSAGQIACLR
eukprot:6455080-Amphidinium_carterae.1